ncbi:hypothetical protein SB761_31845, partial [Pseudomonas sp. SIMBA_064]
SILDKALLSITPQEMDELIGQWRSEVIIEDSYWLRYRNVILHHQPIEHLTQLRATPGLLTLRPGDANETLELWKVALAQTHRPSC